MPVSSMVGQAVAKQGGAAQVAGVAHRALERLGLGQQDDQPPGAGDGGVEQVAAQHATVLAQQRQHHGRVFRALRLVDGDRVGDGQLVQLVGGIGQPAPVDGDLERLARGSMRGDPADIAVVDLALVVVLELHHLVAERRSGSGRASSASGGSGLRWRLQQLVERLGAERPRLIGVRTWTSFTGSSPNRSGMRVVRTSSSSLASASSGSVDPDAVEVAGAVVARGRRPAARRG